MKTTNKSNLLAVALVGALAFTTTLARADDSLPSWNDGPAKQAVVNFVKATTDAARPKCAADVNVKASLEPQVAESPNPDHGIRFG